MNRLLIPCLGILCFLGIAATSSTAADLDPSLIPVLQQTAPSVHVPVLIVMERQGLDPTEKARIRRLPPHLRRTQGRMLLQSHAESSQMDVFLFLKRLQQSGEADSVRSLWMVNALAASVAAGRVPDLLLYAGVRKIAWDPRVPASEMVDDDPGARTLDVVPPDPTAWQLIRIGAPDAWAQGYRGTGKVVGVIDSGIDFQHPDLRNHIYTNPGEIPDNGIDDDNNGFIDDVHGWDFVFGDNNPQEDGGNNHGTRVSGLIVGDGTSGTATGVAPQAEVLPIKALGGSWGTILEALDYAVLMNVDVITMSISQKWHDYPKPDYGAWRAFCENELALGYVHCNSIGNEGLAQPTDPIPFNVSAPGNSPSPWIATDQYLQGGRTSIIAVGGVTDHDIADDGSSRGPSDWEDIQAYYPEYPYGMPAGYQDYPYSTGLGGLIKPDICAPGVNTITTTPGGGYVQFSGTSAATPLVAATAALMLEADSTLTPEQIDMILQTTALDLGDPGKDNVYGAGRVDTYAALERTLNRHQYGVLSGSVRDAATDSALAGADVFLQSGPFLDHLRTNALGRFAIALPGTGGLVYQIRTSAFGYEPDTTEATLTGDSTTVQDVRLTALATSYVTGTVTDPNGPPVPGAVVRVRRTPLHPVTTDSLGQFLLSGVPVGLPFTLEVVRFSYHPDSASFMIGPDQPDTLNVSLQRGLYDDFETDQGWWRDPNDTAIKGWWQRAKPVGTWSGNTPVQPDSDSTPGGTICWLTQNCNPGAGPTFSDVDHGATTLYSPVFDGTFYLHPNLSYNLWYSNNTGGGSDDVFEVDISNDSGQSWVNLETVGLTNASWVPRSFALEYWLPVTTQMRLRFIASDTGINNVVEAALDDVQITENPAGVGPIPGTAWTLRLLPSAPNPFGSRTTVRFQLPQRGPVRLSVFDVQGRWVRDLVRGTLDAGPQQTAWDGRDAGGRRCGSGVYLYRLDFPQAGQRTGRVILVR